jgi:L-asparaginase
LTKILIITTGGTIDKVYFDASSEFEVGDSVVGRLLEQAHVQQPYDRVALMKKDSLEMTDDDRSLIRATIEARPETRVVVTHGTDTLTETAAVLESISDRTIVLTGALAPARFAESDAVFNVGMAFGAVQSLPSGVFIVMNGQVFRSGEVVKDRGRNALVRMP